MQFVQWKSRVLFSAGLLFSLVPAALWAQPGASAPSGTASDGPRSRLTLAGLYTVDTYAQKNFFLGAEAEDTTATGNSGDYDAYWTQRLTLRPRFILSSNLNLNLSVDLAHGIWGLDNQTPDPSKSGYTNLYNDKGSFVNWQVNWAYLAYRHAGSNTRWYLGRQKFGPGNLLVLDVDSPGLQVQMDFPDWRSTLAVSVAKESEGVNGLTDRNGFSGADTTGPTGPDGRDADLVILELRHESAGRGLALNPFAIYYLDRSNADGNTLLPDGVGYLDARFRPNVSRATIIGVAGALKAGPIRVDAEYDYLKGTDRVRNANSGPNEALDQNNGDIKGTNLFGRVSLAWTTLEVGGIVAIGSGDDDPFTAEGNFNSLRSQGNFYITEVWEDGLALDERGLNPDGLGNPFSRGYRGLENTRVFQGFAALQLLPPLKLSGSYSVLRTSKAIRPWFDRNGNGSISRDEYGRDVRSRNQLGSSTDLGNEIDARLDLTVEDTFTITLRGGIFTPGVAAGYLINGTEVYQETVREIRLGVSVPISEFSLGG